MVGNKNNLCIIQARTGSTRLPGKVLMKVNGKTLLEYEIKRIKQSKKVDKIVVATSTKKNDDKIANLCKKIGVDCFRGSEKNVLDRYYQCSLKYPEYGNIIRISADCPLIDPKVIDKVVTAFEKNKKFEYVSNVLEETFPYGLAVEVFSRRALLLAAKNAKSAFDKEHVTPYIWRNHPDDFQTLPAHPSFDRT